MKQQELKNAWKRIKRMFNAYGFPYKVVFTSDHVNCWTGNFCHIIDPTRNYHNISNAIHEFAHWMVSHPNRRNKPDFGLGLCPDSCDYFISEKTRSVSIPFAEREEECASCLGIIIERTLDLNPLWTVKYHNWEGMDNDSKFTYVQAKLRQRRLVDNKNRFPLKPRRTS